MKSEFTWIDNLTEDELRYECTEQAKELTEQKTRADNNEIKRQGCAKLYHEEKKRADELKKKLNEREQLIGDGK